MVLDSRNGGSPHSAALALIGKVYCKVDARTFPIKVGDMLTTAATPGHAMKTNPAQAFGSVLGKAMGALGVGLLPIHVCLQ